MLEIDRDDNDICKPNDTKEIEVSTILNQSKTILSNTITIKTDALVQM